MYINQERKGCRYEHTTEIERWPAAAGPPAEWNMTMPTSGHINFDYICMRLPPPSATALSDTQLREMLDLLGCTLVNGDPHLPESTPPARPRAFTSR